MMNDFQEVLNKCLNPNRSTREEGEALIDQYATNNFGTLLENCAIFLSEEQKPIQLRQLCATLIKNLINFIPKHSGKWDLLPMETKTNVKSYTLSCLASSFKEIRKAAGLTVAGKTIFNLGICKHELPRGEWPEIITILILASENENLNYKMSSLMTIGYIAQEIPPGILNTNEVDSILNALINNLGENIQAEVVELAISALLNFIVFAQKNMTIDNERDLIFQTIFRVLGHNSVEIRVFAMQCLVEMSRVFYDFIGTHLDGLIQTTCNHVRYN
jgi:hypothetical protein